MKIGDKTSCTFSRKDNLFRQKHIQIGLHEFLSTDEGEHGAGLLLQPRHSLQPHVEPYHPEVDQISLMLYCLVV